MGKRGEYRVTWLSRFVRGRRPDRNPLRRACDRVETAVLAVLVIAFLAGAPFTALAAAGWALARGHQVEVTEQSSWHQVTAVVLNVSTGVQGGAGYGAPTSQAQARWTAPDGKAVTGEISVTPGTGAGAAVQLWTTDDGQQTGPPLQQSQVTGQAYFDAAFSVIVLAALLAITWLLTCWVLGRRRMAAWEAEWRATGPRWTART